MTSAQLILVSVSSALIAVIAMLVVATVLRARTRDSTGGGVAQATGPQTRAQRAATRAQGKAQRAALRAERKAAKAAGSVTKAEKGKALALAAGKTGTADGKSPAAGTADALDKSNARKDANSEDVKEDSPGDTAKAEGSGAASSSTPPAPPAAREASGTPDETEDLALPEKQEDEVATTEAGKKASEAKPRARKSLLGRTRSGEDSTEEKS